MSIDGLIFLNNAASSWPKAPGVIEAINRALTAHPSHPGRAVTVEGDALLQCRQRLTALLGTNDPDRIILTHNATHALNLAFHGLNLAFGATVVTTVLEHNSVLRPLMLLAEHRGLRLEIIGLDEAGQLDLLAYDRALDRQPALVAVNHISNVTGTPSDVATLFARAKACGAVTLLDASQSLGSWPVAAGRLNADLIAFTGHKGLLGPPGTGGLYVSPAITLAQVFVGGTGVRSDLTQHPFEMPVRLEAGTPNIPACAGLAAALEWLASNGAVFNAKKQHLSAELYAGLKAIRGTTVYGGSLHAPSAGIVSFRLQGWSVEDVGLALAESFGIACRSGLHCAPLIHQALGTAPEGTVRFSVSGFNTDDEIHAALDAVGSLAAHA